MSQIGSRIRIGLVFSTLAVAALAGLAWLVIGIEPDAASDARRLVEAGRYEDAGRVVARWLRDRPQESEAHLLQGRVDVGLGRLTEAADQLKQAQTLGHALEELAVLRALIASKAGRHAEAEPTLKRAFAQRRKPDRQVDEALARTYLETFNLEAAARVLDRWAREFPGDPKPHLWLAEVHSRAGGDAGAVEQDYRAALARDPSLARAHLGLAEALRKAHRTAEAAAEYSAYFTLEPGDAAAHYGAGQNLREQGDEVAAARHLKRAIELDDKNGAAFVELADAATQRGEWSAALDLLDRAIALDPCDLTLRHRRSLALARLGRTDEARAEQAAAARLRVDLDHLSEVRKRLVAAPHDRKSQLEVARWMFDHAQDQEGARWAERILGEWPGDEEASRMLASYHQRRGETGLANFYELHLPRAGPASAAKESAALKQHQTESAPRDGKP